MINKHDLIIFPTDTIWGIGTALSNNAGIERIYSVKVRPRQKPLAILITDFDQLDSLVEPYSPQVKQLLDENWPGALTVVFHKTDKVSDNITAGLFTVGIRMSGHPVVKEIIQKFGEPIVATSVNTSGEPPLNDYLSILARYSEQVDFIMEGNAGGNKASRVVDITRDPWVEMRV